MAISRPKTVSFRLSESEFQVIKAKAGNLSVGDFARRAALDLNADDREYERRAIGKTIRAIHLAIADGLSSEKRAKVDVLVAGALAVLADRAPNLSGGSQ